MKYILYLIPFLAISCVSTKQNIKKLENINKDITVVDKQLSDKSKSYLHGAIEVLKTDKTKTDLALRLLLNTQDIIGKPNKLNQIDINPLIAGQLTLLDVKEKETNQLIDKKNNLLIKKEQVTTQIVETNKKEILEHKSWYTRLKDSVFNYLMVTAAIVLLLIFGPFLCKLLFNITIPFNPLKIILTLFGK